MPAPRTSIPMISWVRPGATSGRYRPGMAPLKVMVVRQDYRGSIGAPGGRFLAWLLGSIIECSQYTKNVNSVIDIFGVYLYM